MAGSYTNGQSPYSNGAALLSPLSPVGRGGEGDGLERRPSLVDACTETMYPPRPAAEPTRSAVARLRPWMNSEGPDILAELLRRVWAASPLDLVRLVLGDVPVRVAELSERGPEGAEAVLRLEGGPGPLVLFFHFAGREEGPLGQVMFLKTAALVRRFGGLAPVMGVAVFAEAPAQEPLPFRLSYGERELLRLNFRPLRLYDADPSLLLGSPGLAPLVPLSLQARPTHLVEAARVIEQGLASEAERRDQSGLLSMLAGIRFESEMVRELAWRSDMWGSSIYREVYGKGAEEGHARGFEQGFDRGVERGIEKGVQQGVERGMEKGFERGLMAGRADANRQTLLRGLSFRFGGLPDEVHSRIALAQPEQLSLWVDRLFTSPSLESVLR